VGVKERLVEKFSSIPKWAEDFSIDTRQDANISKRDFIRFLFLVSLGLFTGMVGVWLRGLFRAQAKPAPLPQTKILDREDIGIGDSYVFTIPGTREPAILVRLAQDRYVAYSQKCTHLQCPVLWKKAEGKFLCPCHKGAFSVESGEVLYGPPERPLNAIELAVKDEGIFFLGVKEPA